MIPNRRLSSAAIAALTIATFASYRLGGVAAQTPEAESAKTWKDLGFNQLPPNFSTKEAPLFAGLNQARGRWAFEGETTDGADTTSVKGSLNIAGNPSSGMLPMWKMMWGWPADDPAIVIIDTVIASPRQTNFELMLIRIGPMKNPGEGKTKPKTKPTMFKGTWDLKKRTITWTESDLPNRPGRPAEKLPTTPKETFEMLVSADGKVAMQNPSDSEGRQLTIAKAISRTAKAPTNPVTLSGKLTFSNTAEITDDRIKPALPPQATDISLLSERGGHFARYKVAKADFFRFLNGIWEAKKDSSAHKRDMMGGEGEPAKQKAMARISKVTGWEPLKNAVTYYSPSKGSGAMTTYFYDEEAGIAYHDSGYW